jgi:hypothetical protein
MFGSWLVFASHFGQIPPHLQSGIFENLLVAVLLYESHGTVAPLCNEISEKVKISYCPQLPAHLQSGIASFS